MGALHQKAVSKHKAAEGESTIAELERQLMMMQKQSETIEAIAQSSADEAAARIGELEGQLKAKSSADAALIGELEGKLKTRASVEKVSLSAAQVRIEELEGK